MGASFCVAVVVDDTPAAAAAGNVFAPALAGLDAIGVKPSGAGTVYGSGVMVAVEGAVTVCVIVSLTVSITVELTYVVPVLVGIQTVRGAVLVTTMKRSSVDVSGNVIYAQLVLHSSGLSILTMLEVVVPLVVGMLVSCRGPYVDRHVVS